MAFGPAGPGVIIDTEVNNYFSSSTITRMQPQIDIKNNNNKNENDNARGWGLMGSRGPGNGFPTVGTSTLA
jgi:hypothetical protein